MLAELFVHFVIVILKKNEMPPFNSILNALDPGNIPFYLKNLTYMEKRLLCKIRVFMTVVILPGGQLAEKGLAILKGNVSCKSVAIL